MFSVWYEDPQGEIRDAVVETASDLRELVKTLYIMGTRRMGAGCSARTFLEWDPEDAHWYVSHVWNDFYTGEPSGEYSALMGAANIMGRPVAGARCYGI